MMNLIPNERWEYHATDFVKGLVTATLRKANRSVPFELPELGQGLPVRSARVGIVVALKALGLTAGASVGVPLYCCPVVLTAIDAAGYRPRFVDVDPENYCISPVDLAAKRSQLDAVIAVHMFGNVCDIPALRSAAPGKPLIEDCAQALGSRFTGQPAGSFGDIAIFSSRSGKYLSVGEGGAVYTRHAELQSRLAEFIAQIPAASRVQEGVHVVKTYLRTLLRTKPLWGLLGSRLWDAYSERISHTSPSAITMGQIYETDRRLATRRLLQLSSEIEKQRRNADFYSQKLVIDRGALCSEPEGSFYNRLQYPLLLSTTAQRDRIAARLRKDSISTSKPYKDIAALATSQYGYCGDCPQAEQVAKTVLAIPCNYALTAHELNRIVVSVNRAWRETEGFATPVMRLIDDSSVIAGQGRRA